MGSVFAVGSNAISVNWSEVPDAGGYTLRVASEPTLTDYSRTLTIPSGSSGITVTGLEPGTTYWVGLRANATAPDTASNFSVAKRVVMPEASQPGVVGNLQTWLGELETLFQNIALLVPQLETTNLNTTDRRRLLGSGVRRYGFIEKVFEVSGDFPQFWPPFGEGREELSEYVNEIDVLRNLLIWFRCASRVVQDLLLIAGDNAFRVAGEYYTFANAGARRKNPEAVQVYEMLRLFWKRRRRSNGEPTEKELERNFNALMRGTQDGTVSVSHESDSVLKGKRVVIDNTHRRVAGRNAPGARGGVRVVDRIREE